VLGSHRPEETPDHVVVDRDPQRLLQHVRERNNGGDVHLVGGPRTIETYRRLGALDRLGLIILPLLIGDGLQLTPAVATDTALKLEETRTLPTGAVELVYVFT
jgi:dihydrofolate reductase